MSFKQDLELGERAEYAMVRILNTEMKLDCYKKKGEFKGWDIKDRRFGWKFEVKYDRESKKYGRTAIEFRSNGVLSGISTTTADFWIQIYHYKGLWWYQIMSVKDLKYLVKNYYKQFPRSMFRDIGDGADAICIPCKTFELWKYKRKGRFGIDFYIEKDRVADPIIKKPAIKKTEVVTDKRDDYIRDLLTL